VFDYYTAGIALGIGGGGSGSLFMVGAAVCPAWLAL